MRMPFGKHRGENIEDLPHGYCVWLLDNVDMDSYLRAAIERRLSPPPPRVVYVHPDYAAILKPIYHRAALKHHPDKGGSTEAMQAVNAFYDEIIEALEDA